MENVEIANVLNEVADLLEIEGANRFRVRAYRNGARTVSGLGRSVAEMVEAGEDLTELPGIGEDLARYIRELVETGELGLRRELAKRTPESLPELMRLEGIGPKRARALHEQLGVRTVADLEAALEAGKVERLRGFGATMVERLRRSIRERREWGARFKLSDADELVRPLLEYMGTAPAIERLEVAGSYRRRAETVGDIDLLAIASESGAAMDHFTSYPGVRRVQMSGGTRGAIVLGTGLRVDLRILPREAYGAALHHFTGSKSHNIRVRTLGIERGLKINEYGVFRGDRRIGGEREADVFDAVGMAWVPPELREDRGEVEAALETRLPKLITRDRIRGDLQLHTTWSDGQGSIEEMARACADLGYEYMAVTDHSRAVSVARGLDTRRLEQQWREIDGVRRRVKDVHIFRGMEVDILPDGGLDLPEDHLRRLDIVVAAVHSHMGMSKQRMTDRVLKALGHPWVDILAHPTGRLLGRREAYAIDVDAVLRAAADAGVAVELNAQPERLDLSDRLVQRAKQLGTKLVIDTDAHSVDTLRYMGYGVDQARRGWLESKHVLNTSGLGALRRWLDRRRRAGPRAAD